MGVDVVMRRVRDRERPIGWTGAFRLAIVAFLVVFQNLAGAASPTRFAHHSGRGLVLSSGENCAPVDTDKTKPDRLRRSCGACCILCDHEAHGAPPMSASQPENSPYPAGSNASIRPFLILYGAPIGWTSSWSSRAPPCLS